MYHFVKFNQTWYLKPESLPNIIEHFNKICGREMKDGFEDFADNTFIGISSTDGNKYLGSYNHANTVWRHSVELCEMKLKHVSWLVGSTYLEKKTFLDRISSFLDGKEIYLTDGLPYYCSNKNPMYDEEVWRDTLYYPYEYKYEDCRFIQWPGGNHWYAKVGNIDICDKNGNYKWHDKHHAKSIAKEWCRRGGNWNSIN